MFELNKTPRRRDAKIEDDISYKIIGAAIEVHRVLGGPGLLESIYENALSHELSLQGLQVKRQLPISVTYKGVIVKDPFYLDILVEDKVIIEVKSVERDFLLHQAQVLTYLRLTGIKLGLLINFGKEHVKDGVCRIVNGL